MTNLVCESKTPLLTSSIHLPSSATGDDRILAAIDVGTNSIHMVVVKIQPTLPAFTIIAREKATVRLGDRDKRPDA